MVACYSCLHQELACLKINSRVLLQFLLFSRVNAYLHFIWHFDVEYFMVITPYRLSNGSNKNVFVQFIPGISLLTFLSHRYFHIKEIFPYKPGIAKYVFSLSSYPVNSTDYSLAVVRL